MLRLRRSELATPGDSERKMASAAKSQADMVFLDLEDAVAPSAKDLARDNVCTALRDLDWGDKTVGVRINGLDDHNCHRDVIDIVLSGAERLDVIIIPKVKTAEDVLWVDRLLTQVETRAARARPIGLEILIEEVEALINVVSIAGASPRAEALIFGFGDYSASQGIKREELAKYPGDAWNYHRNQMIIAARAHGLAAIDGPYGNYGDLEGFRREAERASILGASGKWAIHPSQIEPANEIYSPSPQAVETARRMVSGYEAAEAAGQGAAQVDGRLVDAASMRIYRPILELAQQVSQRPQRNAEGAT